MTDVEFYQEIFSKYPKAKEKFQMYLIDNYNFHEESLFYIIEYDLLYLKISNHKMCVFFELAYGLFDDFLSRNYLEISVFPVDWDIEIGTTWYKFRIDLKKTPDTLSSIESMTSIRKKETKKQAIIKAFELLEKELNK